MVEGLHMTGGEGATSYAANSLLQRKAMLKAKPLVRQAIQAMLSKNSSRKVVVADLGCSSGPNTLHTVYGILDTIIGYFRSCNTKPEVQFFLNDLPGNDFNSLFQSLVSFRKKQLAAGKGDSFHPLYVSGVPGSFYERILPDASVHFVHSSYSLHFLSQDPRAVRSEKQLTSDNSYIYLSKKTPTNVINSYKEQYHMDFTLFLNLRAEELVDGGYMALLFLGRTYEDPTCSECSYLWGALADVLNDMVEEGLVDEIHLDRFKLPFYSPSLEEVRAIIREQKSFEIEVARTFRMNWDPYIEESGDDDGIVDDDTTSGVNVANYIKAVVEPIIKFHFKGINTDDVFARYARKVATLPKEYRKYQNIMLILKKSI